MKRQNRTKILAVAAVAALGVTSIAQAGGPPESNAGAGSTPEQVNSTAGVTKDNASSERTATSATNREELPASSATSTPAAGSSSNPGSTATSPAAASGTTGTDAGSAATTTDATPAIGTATGGSPGNAMSREGLIRHEGDTYFIKEGRAQKVDNEMKLSEGITAQENGKVTLKDGTELTLEEGKMVTLEGKVVDTPAQVSSIITSTPTTLTPQE